MVSKALLMDIVFQFNKEIKVYIMKKLPKSTSFNYNNWLIALPIIKRLQSLSELNKTEPSGDLKMLLK